MIILWLVSVYLLARHLPLPKVLSGNVVWRWLLAVALSLIFFSGLALGFYFVGVPTSPLVYQPLLLVAAIFIAIKFPKNSLKPSRQDLWLVLPALAVMIFFGVNIFLDGYGKHNFSQTAILQSISKAEDDAGNHLMLFSRFFMNDNSTLTFDSYTAGYEWSTALLANSIVPSWLNPPAIFMVDFYVVFKLVTFGAAMLALTILLYELYKKYIHRQLTIKHHFLLVGLALVFGGFIFAPLYRNGFYSFMPVVIFTTMIMTLLLAMSDNRSKGILLPYILLLTIGISTAWFMAAPVALLVGLVLLISLWKQPRFWLSAGIFLANIVVLLLLFIMLFSAGTIGSAGEALALSGGYPTLSRLFVVAVAALAIGFIIFNRPQLKKPQNLPSLYIGAAIIFALVLWVYFQLTSGSLTYYYLKIETSVLVAILPLAIIFVIYLLRKYNFWWQWAVLAIFGLVYLISQLVSANDYVQYITDWDNKAATLEVNAAVPIVEKLSRPIHDVSQNVCTIIVNKTYIETVNADHIANNTTNRVVENHCLPDNYLAMHNAGELDFQAFVDLAKQRGVKYELFTSELGGGPKIINVSDDPSVEILNY